MLAGGRSTRFGTDKLAITYRNRPLLEHAVDALRWTCGEVIVVLAASSPDPDLPSVRIAWDAIEGEGPLAGLLAGLEVSSSERALAVGGDMPELVPAVLSSMLDRLQATDAGAVALLDGNRMRPLPAALRVARAATTARERFASGERSIRALLQALGADAIDEATWTALDPERRTLFDVDEPWDLPPA